MALLRDGTVRAWGANDDGQLGDGTATDRQVPVRIAALTGIRIIDAGGPVPGSEQLPAGSFSGAVGFDGRLFAWGDNVNGQLGDGAAIGWARPRDVLDGLRDIRSIEAGTGHALAVTEAGQLWSWGRNVFGQLGDGTATTRVNPVPVSGLADVVSADAGGGHSLALTADGSVWSWGFNLFGQIGDGTSGQGPNIVKPTPLQVTGLPPARQVVASGGHSLALGRDGTVWSWGLNAVGELGDGTNVNRAVPGQVMGLPEGVVAIASAGGVNLALVGDGTVWAWGDNRNGQLGDGTTDNRNVPVPVHDLRDVRAIATGYHHSLALLRDGTVRAWGLNDQGQLGDGTTTNRSRPVEVPGLTRVTVISANGGGDDLAPGRYGHSLALLEDGTVRAWGANERGQLGDGTTVDRPSPVVVTGLEGIRGIEAGGEAPVTRPGPSGEFNFAWR